MRTLRAWILRFRGLFNKQQRDGELAAELDGHLRNNIEDNLRAGMSPEEARRQALIKLGGLEQTKEQYRDRRGIPWVEMLLQDLRYTFRTLRKDRAFAIFAILIVGLGIGASCTIFSVVNTLLLRPLPFREPASLVWLANHPTYGSNDLFGANRSGGISARPARANQILFRPRSLFRVLWRGRRQPDRAGRTRTPHEHPRYSKFLPGPRSAADSWPSIHRGRKCR